MRLVKASGFIYSDRVQELMQGLLMKEKAAASQ